jgi:hypothetical protein
MDTFRKLSLIILLFLSLVATSQEKKEEKIRLKDRFVFGGTLGAQFGSYTSVLVSPSLGFYITPRLLAGTNFLYQYYYEKWLKSEISTHIFGTSLFSEYAIINNIGKSLPIKADFSIITHVEYELLNLDRDFSNTISLAKVDRFWLHGILIGGGLKQNIGKRSSLNITFLYNLLWDNRTPYTNPLIRIGVYL